MSGEVTIDLQLPDKMLRTETMSPMGDVTIVTEQGRQRRQAAAQPAHAERAVPA